MIHDDVIVKFCKEDGSQFIIKRDGDWRFLKNGLVNISSVNGQLTYADNIMTDGGVIQNVRLTRVDRTIKTAYMLRDHNAQARRQFAQFFIPKTTYKIYVTYMNVTRWAEGTLYKLQMSEQLESDLLLTATMTFAFADPRWKSVDDFGKNIAEIIPMKGFPYMCKIGGVAPTGTYAFEKVVHLFNDGDTIVYPSIIINANGPAENPKIIINNSFIRINDVLSTNDRITIELGALPPRVEKNGRNYFGHVDKQSQLTNCYLQLGDNIVSFSADDGASNLAIFIYYNKMYMVI